jgi:hypothetical protein
MDSRNVDKLLQEGLSGDPPAGIFREKALLDSTSAFVEARRSGARWRIAAMGVAASILIAGSFLIGRCSVTLLPAPSAGVPIAMDAGETVTISSDVVAWLEAARLFQRLGMEDRVARALDHAGRLLPSDLVTAGNASTPVLVVVRSAEDHERDMGTVQVAGRKESGASENRIVAQVLGD